MCKDFIMPLFMAANNWKQYKSPAMNDYLYHGTAIRIKR